MKNEGKINFKYNENHFATQSRVILASIHTLYVCKRILNAYYDLLWDELMLQAINLLGIIKN